MTSQFLITFNLNRIRDVRLVNYHLLSIGAKRLGNSSWVVDSTEMDSKTIEFYMLQVINPEDNLIVTERFSDVFG